MHRVENVKHTNTHTHICEHAQSSPYIRVQHMLSCLGISILRYYIMYAQYNAAICMIEGAQFLALSHKHLFMWLVSCECFLCASNQSHLVKAM